MLDIQTLYVLTKRTEIFDRIFAIGKEKSPGLVLVHCANVRQLCEYVPLLKENDMLLSFGHGDIVPPSVLSLFKTAINVHPASPAYPGRDAHFYAAYDGVTEYGATAHVMTPKVDDGEILDIELVSVKKDSSGMELLEIANSCAFALMERLFMCEFNKDIRKKGISWGERKTKRADLPVTCKILSTDSAEEVERKFRAFQKGSPFKNLYIDVYGFRFRFEDIVSCRERGGGVIVKMAHNFLTKAFPFVEKVEETIEAEPLWLRENFFIDLPEKWNLSLSFLVEGIVAGFAIVSQKTPFCAHLHRLCVLPYYRNQGIAGDLISSLKNLCKNSYKFLTLSAYDNKENLLKFYQKRGFFPMREEEKQTLMICHL
ncbi:MAG: GNAT family N-acetyltransferase [Holosporales bacterium]|jgi:methionyl-tRNA formyltransferase|nr:GNAT family N-acetyltransferase [Holosporales bacterium]